MKFERKTKCGQVFSFNNFIKYIGKKKTLFNRRTESILFFLMFQCGSIPTHMLIKQHTGLHSSLFFFFLLLLFALMKLFVGVKIRTTLTFFPMYGLLLLLLLLNFISFLFGFLCIFTSHSDYLACYLRL